MTLRRDKNTYVEARASVHAASEEVEHRKEEDPHDVHEVPVEPGQLQPAAAGGPPGGPARVGEHDEVEHDAAQDVQRVERRQREVARPEDVGVGAKGGGDLGGVS